MAPIPPLAPRCRVAVMGGGFTGAAIALELARQTAAEIIVIEPRPVLGAGLAYSTPDPAHRLNVPACRMTIDPGVPDDFARWLAAQGALAPGCCAAEHFAPRRQFGDYVRARLAPALASGRVLHRRAAVASACWQGGGWSIGLSDGGRLSADLLVLAASHPPPSVPPPLAALAGHPRLVADPCRPGALDGIGPGDTVLIVGTGLTSADVVATLEARGHRGAVTRISRRGLVSRMRGPEQAESTADFAADPARTAGALLRRVRAQVAQDAARGLTWHACFDRLREQGTAIWAALPAPERRRLLRHLRPYWDAHRYRLAPPTAEALARAGGRLTSRAARLVAAQAQAGDAAFRVTLRPRRMSEAVTLDCGWIVLTTGPDHAALLRSDPVLAQLAGAGHLRPDAVGLGPAALPDGRALDAQGRPHDRLLIAGPLARGSIGELVGAPEIATFTRAMIGALVARAWGAPAPVPSPPACTADPPALSASPHLAAAAPAGR